MNYPKDMAKQVIQFYKTTFDNSFVTLVMLQDQAEKLLKTFVEQAPGMSDEGRKVLDQWTSVYKKAVMISRRLWTRGMPRSKIFSIDS